MKTKARVSTALRCSCVNNIPSVHIIATLECRYCMMIKHALSLDTKADLSQSLIVLLLSITQIVRRGGQDMTFEGGLYVIR